MTPHSSPAEELIDFAVSEILEYLRLRPASADTLEGIHRWWIRWPDTEAALAVSEAALERLEERGDMQRVQVGSSLLWRGRRD